MGGETTGGGLGRVFSSTSLPANPFYKLIFYKSHWSASWDPKLVSGHMVLIAYSTFGDAGVEYLVGYLFSQFFWARILIVDEDSRIKRKNINHQQEDKHEHKTTKQHRTAISNKKNKNTKEQL